MEIAKFILTTIGTFISVSGLFFAVFQFWVKKREEKDAAFRASVRRDMETERSLSREEITTERGSRKEEMRRMEARIEKLEDILARGVIDRLASLEGELKGMREILKTIQSWFINNKGSG